MYRVVELSAEDLSTYWVSEGLTPLFREDAAVGAAQVVVN